MVAPWHLVGQPNYPSARSRVISFLVILMFFHVIGGCLYLIIKGEPFPWFGPSVSSRPSATFVSYVVLESYDSGPTFSSFVRTSNGDLCSNQELPCI